MWYAVLALSFLSCSLNPVGIAGLAMHILKPHDIYSTQLGWALTAGSFVIALMGFIATERVAYLERNRRALEFASLAACGAAVLAFALGFTMPVVVMWPTAAVLIAIGGLGFCGTTSLPVPGMQGVTRLDSRAKRGEGVASRGPAGDAAVSPAPGPRRKRRRRRRRKPHASAPQGPIN